MGEMTRALTILLFDKFGYRQGWISDPLSISVTPRWLSASTGEITVRASDPKLTTMLEDGARVSVWFADTDNETDYPAFQERAGSQVLSGWLRDPVGGFLAGGSVTFQIQGDWSILRTTPARVVPTNPLEAVSLSDAAQSYDLGAAPPTGEDSGRWGYYQWPSGPQSAAQAVTTFLEDQVNSLYLDQLGISQYIRVASMGGADVTASLPQVRFGTVEDYVVPILRAAGIGFRIYYDEHESIPDKYRHWGSFWVPKTWSTVFTPESGVVRDGQWALNYPNATHITVGGPGELTARAFYGVNDLPLAVAQQRIMGVFREATGAPIEWPTSLAEQYRIAKYYLLRPEITTEQKAAFETFLSTAGTKALTDGAPTSGVSLKLAESEGFRFTGHNGGGFAVGDIVSVAPSAETAVSGLTFTDRITECTIAMSVANGITVTPQLGQKKDDPNVQLALAIRGLADAQARKNTSQ